MAKFSSEDFERNWLWIAADQTGSLGLFQTFGIAPLPATVSSSLEDAETVDAYVQDDLLNRVGACESKLFAERAWQIALTQPHYLQIFRSTRWGSDSNASRERKIAREALQARMSGVLQSASCGLHIYDIMDVTEACRDGYANIAVPAVPLKLDDLPTRIREIVSRTRFIGVKFSIQDVITTQMIAEVALRRA